MPLCRVRCHDAARGAVTCVGVIEDGRGCRGATLTIRLPEGPRHMILQPLGGSRVSYNYLLPLRQEKEVFVLCGSWDTEFAVLSVQVVGLLLIGMNVAALYFWARRQCMHASIR